MIQLHFIQQVDNILSWYSNKDSTERSSAIQEIFQQFDWNSRVMLTAQDVLILSVICSWS